MPMSEDFKSRLEERLGRIINYFGTPFHIYDEKGIRETGEKLKRVFSSLDFREYYAVKANPNPHILKIMQKLGFGFDCSSVPELRLAEMVGALEHDIMFTSNNTTIYEFEEALTKGCVINLDDTTMTSKLPHVPKLICFRYNPGARRTGNTIIGNPLEAKYGVGHKKIIEAYEEAIHYGAEHFGLHTMVCSNERNYEYMVETVNMLFSIAEMISEKLGISFDFINMGGGLGVPYKPEDAPLDLEKMATEIINLFSSFHKKNGYMPKLFMESGRYMTGPHGVLVTTVINRMSKYREYVGVDASMSALMRPGMYNAYHHITVPGKDHFLNSEIVDVVGSLCENNDKFAVQRKLPKLCENDVLIIHDTGAHGHTMGFNYNGRLKPKELLLCKDGSVKLIRREETTEDHLATLYFEENKLQF